MGSKPNPERIILETSCCFSDQYDCPKKQAATVDRLFKIQLIIMIFSVLNWHTETDIAVVGPLAHSIGD